MNSSLLALPDSLFNSLNEFNESNNKYNDLPLDEALNALEKDMYLYHLIWM